MAYNPNDPNKLQDEAERNGQPVDPSQPIVTSTQSATIQGSSNPSTAIDVSSQQTQAAKPSGSGWTNLRTYIERNKPQAEKLGGDVGNLVTIEANKASDTIKAQSDAAQAAVTPEAYQVNKDWLVQGLRSNPQNAKFQQQYTDWANKQAKAFEWSNDSLNAVTAANQKADLTNSEGGRKQLLTELQKPQATAGVSNLNNLFLQSSDEGKQAVGNAVQQFKDIGLEDKLNQAQAAALARQKQAEDVAAASRGLVKDTTSQEAYNMAEGLRVKLGTDLNHLRNEQNRIIKALEAGKNLSKSDLGVLGISAKDYQNYLNTRSNYQAAVAQRNSTDVPADKAPNMEQLPELPNIMDYIKKVDLSDNRYNIASVMNQEDEARAQALAKLAGISGASLRGLTTKASNTLSDDTISNFNLDAWLQEAAKRGY